jgi:hypothetical protein
MATPSDKISDRREEVQADYNAAVKRNKRRFNEGDDKATAEYVFPNQQEDANNIVNEMYQNDRSVISIQKPTKVGANGLMIYITYLLTTHNDDKFVVDFRNVRIITGMSSADWQKELIDNVPACFKDSIFHHGQLQKADLDIKNGLLIIDETDSGNKEEQVLHKVLKEAGVLNVEHMKKNNNRFVFISATMAKELYNLYQWGSLHKLYKMTIPSNYIGHKDFLDKGIIQEFYPLNTMESAERWIQEDILDKYGNDFRVHIVRVKKNENVVQNACIIKKIGFRNHTSNDRLTKEDEQEFFRNPLTQHIVIAVKGLLRRATLLPNTWKFRIGATHELYTAKVDNNVQVQGLPGRMTGYWRNTIEAGHKTGPHRTSIQAITQYQQIYEDPFGPNSYSSSGFKKKEGRVVISENTVFSPNNIENLEPGPLPEVKTSPAKPVDPESYRIYSDEEVVKKVFAILGYNYKKTEDNNAGFKETSMRDKSSVVSLEDAVKNVPKASGGGAGGTQARRYYPCYVDTKDNKTLRFVVIIEKTTDKDKIKECDEKYPSIPYK